MEFASAIVDECGSVVAWCAGMSERDIAECLANHPEWRRTCIPLE